MNVMKNSKRIGALMLSAVLALSAAAFTAPRASAAQRLNARQQAIVDTALAFYYKGAPMQYDSTNYNDVNRTQGGDYRQDDFEQPEYATPDTNYYTVCSSFCFEVYYNAIGYKLEDDVDDSGTVNLIANDDASRVYYWDGTTDRGAALIEARKVLQPGDMIVGRTASDGHAMMYVGDAFGDGQDYIVHSWGGKYDLSSGVDAVEPKGNILKDNVDSFCFSRGTTWSLYDTVSFGIFRPLNIAPESDYPVTAAAKARRQYPNVVVNRTASVKPYGTVQAGDEITYTVEVSNHHTEDYNAFSITENVPENTTLTAVDGKPASGRTALSWSITIPAGEKASVSYTVKVTGKRGDTITAAGGTAGGLVSNSLKTTVGGKPLAAKTAAELKKAAEAFTDLTADKFANALTKSVWGVDLTLPTAAKMARSVFQYAKWPGTSLQVIQPCDTVAAEYQSIADMVVPGYVGGTMYQLGDNAGRVTEMRAEHLRAGDILYLCNSALSASSPKNQICFVSSDGKLVSVKDGDVSVAAASTVARAHSCEFFVLLRPSLAYDDAAKSCAALSFTDVATSDWYYTYVRDLVADGTVAGMTPTTFKPAGTVTYGQALKLIALAAGEAEQKATAKHWASGYLTLAQSKDWLTGSPNLDGNISRLALCQIAAKALGLTEQPAANPFTDTADQSVLALNKAGVINGMTDTTFAPDKTLTRAQITKIIWCMGKL